MNPNAKRSVVGGPVEAQMEALARVADEARDTAIRELSAENVNLRARASRFETALDVVPFGVCLVDREGRSPTAIAASPKSTA